MKRWTIPFGVWATVLAASVVYWGGSAISGAAGRDTSKAELPQPSPGEKVAIFAGGCFWCVESAFDKAQGVRHATSGYTGGKIENPSYEDVGYGRTSHLEAVHVVYDPKTISYAELVELFWRQIDPTDAGGQFADRGHHYSTAIFYSDAEQKRIAEKSKAALAASGRFDKPIVTPVKPAGTFWPAESYHQDYHLKNPAHYKSYRRGSGRTGYLERVWGAEAKQSTDVRPYTKPDDATLRKRLTDMQYRVTQAEGTEPPFQNEFWNNKRAGIYVDVVTGEPLFSSHDKFSSGTGWPSFTRPLVPENVVEKKDQSLFISRTEVRSKHGDSHLGHVFTDGPKPTGLRYCINSAALEFVPVEKLEARGYGQFADVFKSNAKD